MQYYVHFVSIEMKVTLLLCMLHCIVFSDTQSFVPTVIYVSFLVNETTKYISSGDIIIMNVTDDTPLVELKLPTVFPFFGEFIDRVFVSPNGYVQSSPVNLCGCCFCDPCRADYFGMIAGILNDFNTFDNDLAHVSVQQDDMNVSTIYYNNINLFGKIYAQFDFGIKLYPDGAVYVMYDNVTNLLSTSDSDPRCRWLTGLIGPSLDDSNGEYVVTEEQIYAQEAEWDARNVGIYPHSRSGVQTGSHYVMCPLSTTWGCAPATLNVNSTIMNVTTLSMSCISEVHNDSHSIQLALFFSSEILSNSSNFTLNTSNIAECEHMTWTAKTLEFAPFSFTCNISDINMTDFTDNMTVFIYVLWKPSSDSLSLYDYRMIGADEQVPPIPVIFGLSTNDSDCAMNTPVEACTACEVVESGWKSSQDLSCLSLDCSLNETSSPMESYHTTATFSSYSSVETHQSLYVRPSCFNNSCSATFDYKFDKFSECCLISDMDCLGICNGTAVSGRDPTWGWLRCCSVGDVLDCLGICGGSAVHDCFGVCDGQAHYDCFGICNGTAVIDACGVCDGENTVSCPPINITVDTGANPLSSNHHLLTVYDASNPEYTSIAPIVVHNTNSVPLNISFSYNGQHILPPKLLLPVDMYTISPYANDTFDIYSNITDLFDQGGDWTVNSFSIK